MATVPNLLEGDNLFKGGGRDVFLINQLMDTVEFTEEGRKVLMRKQWKADGSRGSSFPTPDTR